VYSCPTVDQTKTLAELAGVSWPIPGPGAKPHVRERYACLSQPLAEWTIKELIQFLRWEVDPQILIWVAIARLEDDPCAAGTEGEAAEGELLCHVLESTAIDWRVHPDCVRRMRQHVASVENQIFQIDDPWAQKTALVHLYRAYSRFEARLSAIGD
jgi:hypothetical protein